MVKIVRGVAVEDVLCAAKQCGDDLLVYVPLGLISQPLADALADVLSTCVATLT
jgi:hypothetical protein